jgi:hypothetical protein
MPGSFKLIMRCGNGSFKVTWCEVPHKLVLLSTASKVFYVLIFCSKFIFQCCGSAMIYFLSGWEKFNMSKQTSQGQMWHIFNFFSPNFTNKSSGFGFLDPDPSSLSDQIRGMDRQHMLKSTFEYLHEINPPCYYWNIPNSKLPLPNYPWLKQVASAPVLFSFFSCWPVFFDSIYEIFYKSIHLFFSVP